MYYLPVKTFGELMAESLDRLRGTRITETGPGGVARLLLAIVNESLAGFYRTLELAHLNAFLSTASGAALDVIGHMVRCERYQDEPDDEYRYRISKQTLAEATANRTAIRLAVLSAPGVRDVVMHEFARGTGSGAIYVVIDDMVQRDEILEEVAVRVDQVKGWGVNVELLTPDLVPIELSTLLLFAKETTEVDRQVTRNQAAAKLAAHLNSLNPGESLLVADLERLVREISAGIQEIRIQSLKRKGRAVPVVDQTCRWNERFVQAPTLSSVVVT